MLTKLENSRREIEFLEKNRKLIDENKNFNYSISVEKFKKE